MIDLDTAGQAGAPPKPAAFALLPWLRESARSALFMAPRWQGLRASPGAMAVFLLLDLLLTIGFGRQYVLGPAEFHWQVGISAWFHIPLLAWACYVMRPQALEQPEPERAPGAAHLMTMLMAQMVVVTVIGGMVFRVLERSGAMDKLSESGQWLAWRVPVAWAFVIQALLLLRAGDRKPPARLWAMLALALSLILTFFIARPPEFWRAVPLDGADEPFQLTQEVMEAQAPLLAEQVAALKPQRPGVIDMYTLTFAPYEGQEVFRRESTMVSQVMAQRFDAAGRGLQLLNHRDTAAELPWATPLNLQRAIFGIAKTMDRDEDVLFIHLTSHGASDGELAATFWPMDVEPVMPADLKQWLDEAGIRHRVISISACFAGNWIAPLAAEDTLVMTASDADHTSYGCGSKSELTFFGRAMYDEQMRTETLSFAQAHAAARKVILQREQEAGKSDGYSNPQIKAGQAIGPYLQRLEQDLRTRR